MSPSVAASRRGDSKATRVARRPETSDRALRRAALFGGRNPKNRKRSVGRPETDSAASSADGPGTEST